MFPRVFMTISAVVVATMMSFMGVSGVNASTSYDPKEECDAEVWEKWGNNCDGLHITITNNTNDQLDFWKRVGREGVYTYPETIKAGETTVDGELLGRETFGGGPATITFNLSSPNSDKEWRSVWIQTYPAGLNFAHCATTQWLDWAPGMDWNPVTFWGWNCQISYHSIKDPISVTFS